MPVKSGRTLLIKKDGTLIASVRTKSITVNKTPIDVTTDDENGVITSLTNVAGTAQLTLEVSGLHDSSELQDAGLSTGGASTVDDLEVTLNPAKAITGDFFITSYAESGSYEGAMEFTASLVSSGPWTVGTPA